MVKKAAYGLLAAFLAAGVYGAIPTTAEGWYTPSGGFSAASGTGTIYYGYDRATGQWQTATVTVDEQGNIKGGDIDFGRDYDLMTAYQALAKALYNEAYNAVQDEAIQTIGKNLHALTSKDGIHIRNENTGQEFTIKFGGSIASAVSGESGDIPATSDAADPVDGSSLGWRSDGKLQVSAWDTVPSAGDTLANKLTSGTGYVNDPSRSLALVTRTASGNLRYLAIGVLSSMMTVDGKSIETNAQNEASVYGYAGAEEGTVAFKTENGLEWRAPDGVTADEASITTNTTDGAVSVVGFSDADESAESTSPYLPYADGSGSLAWRGVLDFFNTGLFDLTEGGKVNLKGVSADENDLRVMTVSAGDSGAAITSSSISSMIDTPLDMSDQKITVSGWDAASPGASSTLAEQLTGGTGHVNDPTRSTALLARTSSGGVTYMAIGTLGGAPGVDGKSIVTNDNATSIYGYKDAEPGMVAYKTSNGLEWKVPEGAAVDGVSITTNTSDGATSTGTASLYGFNDQEDFAVPYRNDGKLAWRTPGEWLGTSLEWSEVDGVKKLNVAGATTYAGHHSKYYFGTSNSKTAELGWHELPNVTTNRVEGDGRTIASTVDAQDPGLKTLGLLGWNENWSGDPLFVVNAGGSVGYIPLPALTNLAACACSNKWTTALEWLGDGEIGEDGISFDTDSLDQYLYGSLGYIYSTTPNDLHFDNDGEEIEASFGAPANWADGVSLEATDGAYQIAGFASGSSCSATVSAMLSQPTESDAQHHKLLAWYKSDGDDSASLHFVPMGDGIQGGASVDDTTITTNTAHGASTSGVASIYGWSSAESDTFLSKNEGGNLEWRKVDAPGVDDTTIATNTSKQLVLKGFDAAANNTVPMKNENGEFVWSGDGVQGYVAGSGIQIASTNVIAHNFVAGAGISLTPGSEGTAVVISAATPSASTVVDPHCQEITYITEIWYDNTEHKIKAKRQTAKLMVIGTIPEAETFDVVVCSPHSAEHQQSGSSN